jgi:DUF1680 family protein
MLKLESKGKYADVMERALYNTVLGGMSLDGTHFFYVNPLEVVPECCDGNTERNHVKPVRQKWFACACCPPNIARLISSLWEYIYSTKENSIYIHLFMDSEAEFLLPGGTFQIKQTTKYPWDGIMLFDVDTESTEEASICIRIPGWCDQASIQINDQPLDIESIQVEGYAVIKRCWKKGDKIKLQCDMPVELMQAHAKVHYDAGRVAIQRGPLVYCLEEVDNGKYLNLISLNRESNLKANMEENLLGGIVTITGSASRINADPQSDELYSKYTRKETDITVKAIPYFLWNNRELGEMQVWVRNKD